MKKRVCICGAVIWLFAFGMIAPCTCAAQDTENQPAIDGDWELTTVFDTGVYQEQITLRAFPPLVFIRSDSGSRTLGMLIPKDSSSILLWRFSSVQGIGRYKGSLRDDACSFSGSDYERVIAGDAAYYSLFSPAREGVFVARRVNTLALSIDPEGSGTVISDSSAIDCGADCTEQYTGGCRKVTLSAEPAAGWTFSHWETASATVQDNPLADIRINTDINIVAVFVQAGN